MALGLRLALGLPLTLGLHAVIGLRVAVGLPVGLLVVLDEVDVVIVDAVDLAAPEEVTFPPLQGHVGARGRPAASRSRLATATELFVVAAPAQHLYHGASFISAAALAQGETPRSHLRSLIGSKFTSAVASSKNVVPSSRYSCSAGRLRYGCFWRKHS